MNTWMSGSALAKKTATQKDVYSLLNDEHITRKQSKHAKEVWKVFGCENLGEYHDLYLKTDDCLLADVFENFRSI